MFENIGEIILLFWRTLLALPQTWRQRQKVFDQFFEIGNASLRSKSTRRNSSH